MKKPAKPRKLTGSLLSLLRHLLIAYLIVAALAYIFQRRLIYFPDRSDVPAPEGDRYRGIETVALTTSDGLRVLGWYWPGSRPVTLVIFHGNAANRENRLPWLVDLHSLGFGVFILDYRGYGGSEGSPTEEGLYLDGEAAVAWLLERGDQNLVYFGESLGCGVAVELALRQPPRALILQSGFPSAVDVAANAYFFLPVRYLMKDRYENSSKLKQISVPILLIHGERDTIIPPKFGRALFDSANDPKEWYPVPGAGHNDLTWTGGRAYLEAIDRFVRKHVEGESVENGEGPGR